MRVAHEIARIIAEKKELSPPESGRSPAGAPAGRDLRDTVQISSEGRDLQTGSSGRSDGASGARRSEDAVQAQIQQRIRSGFYDSTEVRRSLAEDILSVWGL